VLVCLALLAACGGDARADFDTAAGKGGSTTTGVKGSTTTTTGGTTTSSTGGGTTTTRPSKTTTSRPSTTTQPGPVNLRLTTIATLSSPLDLSARAGEANALYVAEKGGRVRAIRGGAVDPTVVLNLSGEVSTGGEQGLLGLTFSPDGSHIYVNITDAAGDTRILEFAMSGGVANVSTRRELLFADQPAANHNGGGLKFGPDGFLYIALGDGGGSNDTYGNGQNLTAGNPFAKLLRMNVADKSWTVKDYGLRNPFRFSFDRGTGDRWIGDVGQNAWEEVDKDPAGSGLLNFGWARMEGNHPVNGASPPPNHTPPVHEYSHTSGGCVVTGGFVYRGSRIPGLVGTYVFNDMCIGKLWGLSAGTRRDLGPTFSNVVSYGEDLAGELYAVSLDGPIYRIDPA
jgi:glucose/arabinose dehydrogenase